MTELRKHRMSRILCLNIKFHFYKDLIFSEKGSAETEPAPARQPTAAAASARHGKEKSEKETDLKTSFDAIS